MNEDIKIIASMNPEYTENGKDRFIEYEFEKYFSYEYVQKEEDFKSISEDTLKNKIQVSSLKSKLKEIAEDFAFGTEDFMYFVELDDEDYSDSDIEEIKKEVENLKLGDYVKFGEDEAKITVYGGFLTKFLFENLYARLAY